MRDEIETTMRLLGVTKLDQLGPHLVSIVDGVSQGTDTCCDSLIPKR